MPTSSAVLPRRRPSRFLVLSIGASFALVLGLMTPAQAAGTVTGRVVADASGADLAGMTVRIEKKKVPEPDDIKWDDVAEQASGPSGQFSFGGLTAGTYVVSVSNWDGSVGYLPIVGSEFTVEANGTMVLPTFRLVVGAKITGTLSREDGGSALGLGVIAWGPVGSSDPDIVGHADADASGAYTIKGLRTSVVRLEFYDTSGTHLGEYWDDQPSYQKAADLDVVETTTVSGIDATLARGGTISGHVKADDSGSDLEGIQVDAYTFDEESGYWQFSGREALTDADGSYTVFGLRAGVTHVEFTDPAAPGEPFDRTSYDREFYGDQPTHETATGITVTAGTKLVEKDVSLAPRGGIAGKITGAGGRPVSKGQAVLYEEMDVDGTAWWRPVASAPTSSSGQYEIKNVPAGSYQLQFWDMEGNHLTEYFGDAATHDDATSVVVASRKTFAADASLGVDASLPTLTRGGLPTIPSSAPEVGTPLSAYHGGWEPNGDAEFAYEWLRGGTVRVGVGQTYTPTAQDVGSTLAVRVVASSPGYRPSSATSTSTGPVVAAPTPTPPLVTPPLVTAPVTPGTPSVPPASAPPGAKKPSAIKVSAKGARKKATLTITVRASGVTPTGKVTIKLGGRTLKSVTLRNGRAKIVLTKQKKGARSYTIAYSGDLKVRSKSATSTVKIK